MTKGRLEAFSDGVLAIVITIMVLELHAPDKPVFQALRHEWPAFAAYVLSFIYLAIYWNNHHHMLHASKRVTGAVLWANMHLLFWLSLIPFTSAWAGRNPMSEAPVALYGCVLLMAAIAYFILQLTLVAANGKDSPLAHALGRDVKGKSSIVLYVIAVVLSFVAPTVAIALYGLVAMMWLVPDKRIEHVLQDSP